MNDSSFIMILGFSIMKFNKAGNHLESHTYVPNFPSQAEFFKGVPTSDNGLMLGGINPASGLFIVKTDSLLDGGSCGTFNFSGVSNQVMIPIVEVASWSVVNYSIKTGSTFVQDTIALIKTIWCETATNIDEQKYFQNYKVYPNPVSYELNIEKLTLSKAFSSIMIYNSLGIKISEMRNCSDKFTKIDVSKFPSGLYEILLQVEDSKDHIKFIKINQ